MRLPPWPPSKYVVEYEQMWKWMVEFLRKLKLTVNSIRIDKSMIFLKYIFICIELASTSNLVHILWGQLAKKVQWSSINKKQNGLKQSKNEESSPGGRNVTIIPTGRPPTSKFS